MLKVYGDLMSQPTRAVLCFCYLTGITHTFVPLYIHKGDLKKQEFLALNPLGYVPVIQDGDYVLAESHSILTYLHRTNNCADHWYPADPKARGKVDFYLHWHHTGLRHLARVVFHRFEAEKLGMKSDRHQLEVAEKRTHAAFQVLNTWLSDYPFLTGSTISLADLSAVCEVSQGKLISYDLSPFPNVQRWYQEVYQIEGVRKGHEVLEKIVRKYAK